MQVSIQQLFDKLSHLNIDYKLFEHEAFYTVDESSKLKSDLDLKGAHTKNLFLRDKKRKIFLLSCMDNTDVDLKILKNIIPAQGNLSFGSPELLNDKLGVKPGSVSPYALINNHEKDNTNTRPHSNIHCWITTKGSGNAHHGYEYIL